MMYQTKQRSRTLDAVTAFFRLSWFSIFPSSIVSLLALSIANELNYFDYFANPRWFAIGIILVSFLFTWLVIFKFAFRLTYMVNQLEDGYIAVEEFKRTRNRTINFTPRTGNSYEIDLQEIQ